MEQAEVRARTLRRQERAQAKKDLEHDLDIVQKLINNAIHPRAVMAYEALYANIYDAYIHVVSSEV